MGKWKYVNGLVLLVVLVYMYDLLATRYRVPVHIYVIITISWLLLVVLGYYIFSYRIARTPPTPKMTDTEKVVVKEKTERPKVVLRKK